MKTGPGVAWWLRHCTTIRTVPGSIPVGVTGFFSDIFPSDRAMVLGSTQPLVKMSTRNIPRGKGDRCVRLTASPPSRVECLEIWEPKPPGTLWATPGLLRDSFTFLYVKPNIYLWSKLTHCFLEWEILQTKNCRFKENTHFVFNNSFSEIVSFMRKCGKI